MPSLVLSFCRRNGACMMRVLDPEGPFLRKWNKIFLLSCAIALCLDPLLFYTPLVHAHKLCLAMDNNLAITFCVVRSLIDVFYVFRIFLRFRTGFMHPYSEFRGGRLVKDSKAIMKRYLTSFFFIDILSILPLPQIALVIVNPTVRIAVGFRPLTILIISQIFVRFLRMAPLMKEVTKTSGIVSETAWGGAALNFSLYMLSSHIIGSFWYLASVERATSCWRVACAHNRCNIDALYCGVDPHANNSFLISSCSPLEPTDSLVFDYGIYLKALRLQLYTDFSRRFFYSFVWGLRNLSSLGQNLETSDADIGEDSFVVIISITGLILFSFLASNIQRFLQSLTIRADEMRVKLRDREKWMSRTMLPQNLRSRVRRHEQYMWVTTRGLDEEYLISDLPLNLRRDIKRHQCWTLLRRVPMFDQMDERLLDALCYCLKHVLYTADSFIVREGDPVVEMMFIMRGNILTTTTNGGRCGFFNTVRLKAGDFCGEELLTWALDPNSSSILPISTRTVQAVKDVEAFCLMPEDLKSVMSQFRRLHSKQLQQTFRFYSQQWRTWAACFIQAAWRRHCRRKVERELKEAEDGRLQGALHAPSIAAAVYASRFARNLRRRHRISNLMSPKLPTPLPQKPPEPDFSAGDRS